MEHIATAKVRGDEKPSAGSLSFMLLAAAAVKARQRAVKADTEI